MDTPNIEKYQRIDKSKICKFAMEKYANIVREL